MSRLVLPLAEVPACLSESLRACLAAHGISLPAPILIEAGRNMAQGLFSIDESYPPDESEEVTAPPLFPTTPASPQRHR